MLLSTRVSPTFPLLVLRGRIPSRTTRIRIPISLIPFLINPLTVFGPTSAPYFSEPELPPLEPAPTDRMTKKVYSRKKVTIPKRIQVQEFELASGNEETVSHPSSQTKSKLQSKKSIDQNLPIPIKKRTRERTKPPLYPLSHVMSFKKLFPSHKSFLTS